MVEQKLEKIPICPICLENLKSDLYFTSDGYLYDKNGFYKLQYKSPITREKIFISSSYR